MSIKLLYLLRHAKAESASDKLSDEDRALTEKGINDAKKLASKLYKKELNFDLILTSSAIRAITTAQIIAKTIAHRDYHLLVDEDLYHASPVIFLKLVTKLHKRVSKVLFVGHNPGLEEFVQLLSGQKVAIQTCGLIQLTFNLKHWKNFEQVKPDHMKILN